MTTSQNISLNLAMDEVRLIVESLLKLTPCQRTSQTLEVANQALSTTQDEGPAAPDPRKHSSFLLAASDRSIPNGGLFPQIESGGYREGGREMKE